MATIRVNPMNGRVLAVMVILFFLLGMGPVDDATSQGELIDVSIRFSGNQVNILSSHQIVEEYEGFVLASVTPSELNRLTAAGLDVQVEDLHTIGVRGYEFDSRAGQPTLPADLHISSYAGEGYYIVQFRGPVKQEWKDSLVRAGAKILYYVPQNAFLVRASDMSSLKDVQAVQWVGLFQPAYKIAPEVLSAGIAEAEVITFHPEGVASVLEAIPERAVLHTYEGEDFGRVDARLDREQLARVARIPDVNFIQERDVPRLMNSQMQWIMQTNINDNRRIWDEGIMGGGQIVGIADTGLDFDHNLIREDAGTIVSGDVYNVTDLNRRKLVRYWVFGGINEEWAWKDSPNRYDPGAGWATIGHGTMVSGTFGGNDDPFAMSDNDGGAKGAKIFLQDIGDVQQWGGYYQDILSWIPNDFDNLFGPAYDAGARVHSNSWGSSTTSYTQEAMMLDEFMWNNPDFLVVASNGNGGPTAFFQYDVVSPATAKNVLSSGSGDTYPSQGSVAGYSSRGPTSDGRRKPTVVAVGTGVSSMSTGDPWDNTNVAWEEGWGGTSYSAPDHASLAVMTRQYFEEGWWPSGMKTPSDAFNPSGALVKAVLSASAQQMTGSYSDSKNENTWPNNAQGWGRVLLDDALYFAGDLRMMELVDDKMGLSTGETNIESYYVTDSSESLRIMLAWTDYPGVAWTTPNIVNDLDLLVTGPGGETYRGNVFGNFAQGESQPDTGSYDRLNVLEGVHIKNPAEGAWTVEVMGYDVPNGPQPYALVSLGAIGTDWGQVYLDQTIYGETDTIGISVRDTGPTAVNVTIWSDTEFIPEPVVLNETAPGSGRWVGTIDTEQAAPMTDGRLQVSSGDTVTVRYDDDDPVHSSFDTAVIDASYPVISDLFVVNITSTTADVIWRTNEPADSKVSYNVSDPLDNTEYRGGYRMEHDLPLTGLTPETTYLFDVESSDPYAHTTISNNGGLHWQFTTLKMMPEPPTNLRAYLFGASWQHVRIEWDLSVDDATLVDSYDVYYSQTAYMPDGTGYQFLGSVPAGFNFFEHYLAGHGNAWNFYYYVEANYSGGLPSRSEDQVAKLTRWAPEGPVLVSFPLKMVNSSIEWAFKTTNWDKARYYDQGTGEWLEYHKDKNWNDLLTVNQSMGIWVNVTSTAPITSAGIVPKSYTIPLAKGWNLVGFPRIDWGYSVNDLMTQTGADRVEAFDFGEQPYKLYVLSGSTWLTPGEGYWIRVPANTLWILSE